MFTHLERVDDIEECKRLLSLRYRSAMISNGPGNHFKDPHRSHDNRYFQYGFHLIPVIHSPGFD